MRYKYRVFLLSAVFAVTSVYSYISHADSVTLGEKDKIVWADSGITINGSSTDKLSEIQSKAAIPGQLDTQIEETPRLIYLYANSSLVSKESVENKLKAYYDTIATLQGSDTTANGLPTIIFNSDRLLAATANSADQRLVLNRQALAINIAEGKTLTIANNHGSNLTGSALFVDTLSDFFQNGNGQLVFTGNEGDNSVNSVMSSAVLNMGVIAFGNGTTFSNNSTDALGGAIYNNGLMSFGRNAVFKQNISTAADGGAIYNQIANDTYRPLYFGAEATFSENQALFGNGGAIYNSSAIAFADNATFMKNSAKNGGAVYNGSDGGDAILYFASDT